MHSARSHVSGVRAATADDVAFVLELAARFGPTRAVWRSFDEVVSGTREQLRSAFGAQRPTDALLITIDADGQRSGFVYLVTPSRALNAAEH